MKTSHQLARELLALPDLPTYHFDPSRAGMSEESDTSISEPTAELVKADGETVFESFVTIVGEHSESVDDEPTLKAEVDLLEDRERLMFLWSLVSDEHGAGFVASLCQTHDIVTLKDGLDQQLAQIDLDYQVHDEGDEEGRTWRKLIDKARKEISR